MWQDSRGFCAIAFKLPGVASAKDLRRLFGRAFREGAGQVFPGHDVLHQYYLSPTQFFPIPDDPKRRKALLNEVPRIDRKYRYDMYHTTVPTKNGRLCAMAFPWTEMGREAFDSFRERGYLAGIEYQRVDVPGLFQALTSANLSTGPIKVVQADLVYTGDVNIKRVVLAGPDVINSDTFKLLSNAFESRGGVPPKRCAVVFSTASALRVEVDSIGMFRFRINSGYDNLVELPLFLSYLSKSNLLLRSDANPITRELHVDQLV